MFLRAYHMPGMALGTEDIAIHTHIHTQLWGERERER